MLQLGPLTDVDVDPEKLQGIDLSSRLPEVKCSPTDYDFNGIDPSQIESNGDLKKISDLILGCVKDQVNRGVSTCLTQQEYNINQLIDGIQHDESLEDPQEIKSQFAELLSSIEKEKSQQEAIEQFYQEVNSSIQNDKDGIISAYIQKVQAKDSDKYPTPSSIDRDWLDIKSDIIRAYYTPETVNCELYNYCQNMMAYFDYKIGYIKSAIKKSGGNMSEQLKNSRAIQDSQIEELAEMSEEGVPPAALEEYANNIGSGISDVMKKDYAQKLKQINYRMMIRSYEGKKGIMEEYLGSDQSFNKDACPSSIAMKSAVQEVDQFEGEDIFNEKSLGKMEDDQELMAEFLRAQEGLKGGGKITQRGGNPTPEKDTIPVMTYANLITNMYLDNIKTLDDVFTSYFSAFIPNMYIVKMKLYRTPTQKSLTGGSKSVKKRYSSKKGSRKKKSRGTKRNKSSRKVIQRGGEPLWSNAKEFITKVFWSLSQNARAEFCKRYDSIEDPNIIQEDLLREIGKREGTLYKNLLQQWQKYLKNFVNTDKNRSISETLTNELFGRKTKKDFSYSDFNRSINAYIDDRRDNYQEVLKIFQPWRIAFNNFQVERRLGRFPNYDLLNEEILKKVFILIRDDVNAFKLENKKITMKTSSYNNGLISSYELQNNNYQLYLQRYVNSETKNICDRSLSIKPVPRPGQRPPKPAPGAELPDPELAPVALPADPELAPVALPAEPEPAAEPADTGADEPAATAAPAPPEPAAVEPIPKPADAGADEPADAGAGADKPVAAEPAKLPPGGGPVPKSSWFTRFKDALGYQTGTPGGSQPQGVQIEEPRQLTEGDNLTEEELEASKGLTEEQRARIKETIPEETRENELAQKNAFLQHLHSQKPAKDVVKFSDIAEPGPTATWSQGTTVCENYNGGANACTIDNIDDFINTHIPIIFDETTIVLQIGENKTSTIQIKSDRFTYNAFRKILSNELLIRHLSNSSQKSKNTVALIYSSPELHELFNKLRTIIMCGTFIALLAEIYSQCPLANKFDDIINKISDKINEMFGAGNSYQLGKFFLSWGCKDNGKKINFDGMENQIRRAVQEINAMKLDNNDLTVTFNNPLIQTNITKFKQAEAAGKRVAAYQKEIDAQATAFQEALQQAQSAREEADKMIGQLLQETEKDKPKKEALESEVEKARQSIEEHHAIVRQAQIARSAKLQENLAKAAYLKTLEARDLQNQLCQTLQQRFEEFKNEQKTQANKILTQSVFDVFDKYQVSTASNRIMEEEMIQKQAEFGENKTKYITERIDESIKEVQVKRDLHQFIEACDMLDSIPTWRNMIANTVRGYLSTVNIGKGGKVIPTKPSFDHFNLVLMGTPGIGKSFTAERVGKALLYSGLLTNGDFVNLTKSDLIGQYTGQTAPKVYQALTDSLGKVVLIDEAYSLAGEKKSDGLYDPFGTEALDAITEFATNHIGLLSMVAAGYEYQMQTQFIDVNVGLPRRFPEESRLTLLRFNLSGLWNVFKYNMCSNFIQGFFNSFNTHHRACFEIMNIMFNYQAGNNPKIIGSPNLLEDKGDKSSLWQNGKLTGVSTLIKFGSNEDQEQPYMVLDKDTNENKFTQGTLYDSLGYNGEPLLKAYICSYLLNKSAIKFPMNGDLFRSQSDNMVKFSTAITQFIVDSNPSGGFIQEQKGGAPGDDVQPMDVDVLDAQKRAALLQEIPRAATEAQLKRRSQAPYPDDDDDEDEPVPAPASASAPAPAPLEEPPVQGPKPLLAITGCMEGSLDTDTCKDPNYPCNDNGICKDMEGKEGICTKGNYDDKNKCFRPYPCVDEDGQCRNLSGNTLTQNLESQQPLVPQLPIVIKKPPETQTELSKDVVCGEEIRFTPEVIKTTTDWYDFIEKVYFQLYFRKNPNGFINNINYRYKSDISSVEIETPDPTQTTEEEDDRTSDEGKGLLVKLIMDKLNTEGTSEKEKEQLRTQLEQTLQNSPYFANPGFSSSDIVKTIKKLDEDELIFIIASNTQSTDYSNDDWGLDMTPEQKQKYERIMRDENNKQKFFMQLLIAAKLEAMKEATKEPGPTNKESWWFFTQDNFVKISDMLNIEEILQKTIELGAQQEPSVQEQSVEPSVQEQSVQEQSVQLPLSFAEFKKKNQGGGSKTKKRKRTRGKKPKKGRPTLRRRRRK